MNAMEQVADDSREKIPCSKAFRVTLKKGVLIEEALLAEAGIERDYNVEIDAGRIILSSSTQKVVEEEPTEKGWDLWEMLGAKAVPGVLEDPSENHDKYLYESK